MSKITNIGSLVPSRSIDKLPLNKNLENVNKEIINVIRNNPNYTNTLLHMINTILKIPKMYQDHPFSRILETEVVTIFTDVAVTPTYSGGLTKQQAAIEELINRTVDNINTDLLSGLSKIIDINANKGGWGLILLKMVLKDYNTTRTHISNRNRSIKITIR